MLHNFLDKKNLQEITQIFKQHVQYQYSSKEQMPDISVVQQDKINRFLNCYQPYFTDYLTQDNTYQHFDYYRILSKYIKVFDLEKGKKFRRNNYDGLYIILKGFIQEIIVDDQQNPEEEQNNVKTKKSKSKQQDPIKMSKIVNMVVGINRIKGSSNDISQRGSFQTVFNKNNNTDSDSNHFFGNTPNNEGQSNINSQRNQQNSIGNSISALSSHKPSQNEISSKANQFFQPQKQEYLPNSPEPQNSQNRLHTLKQLNDVKISDFDQPQDGQKKLDQIQAIENKLIQEDINQQNNKQGNSQKRHFKNLKLQLNLIKYDNFQLQRGDTEIQDEKLDDVHELQQNVQTSPIKASIYENTEKKNLFYNASPASSSSSNLLNNSPLKILESINDKQNYIEQMTQQVNMNKANYKLKKKLSFMIAMQPKSSNPFPEFQNRPFNILTNGDIIDLIKIKENQRKYYVQEIEDSICLYIGKKSMKKAFQEQIQQLRYKTLVLEKFFNNVPQSKIMKLAYHFYEKTLFKNQIVYKQGEQRPHFIYLIKSGEVQISETITQPKNKNKILESVDSPEREDKNQQIQSTDSQVEDETYDLQSLCRKKLNSNSNNQFKQTTLQIPKLTKILCSLGEEEIFGIEEIILQKENREFQVVVSSSQAEFYVIPEDLFENFRQTESDSILSWFKQKEIFYQQQRNMHKRIKGNRVIAKSSNQEFFSNKKIQQACQYLFQEDEQTFNNRLDQLHNKKIIQLKNYYQYKEYQAQNQNTNRFSQSYLQATNDSINFNSPRNVNQTFDRNFSKDTQQSDNQTKQNIQFQAQSSKALLLNKISQQNQQLKVKSYCEIQNSQSTMNNLESQRGQNQKQEYLEQFKNHPLIRLQSIQSQDNPYLLTDRGNIKKSIVEGIPLVENGNAIADEENKSYRYYSARQIENQQSNQSEQLQANQLQIKKVVSTYQNIITDQTKQTNQFNNQDQNFEQYKISMVKNDGNKKNNLQISQNLIESINQKRNLSKNSRVLKNQESLCSIDLEQNQSQVKQTSQNEQQQTLLGVPASLEYVSKYNQVQSTSGDILNLGRIHHMIKSNTQIIKQQFKIKGKHQLFQKPIFDELKKENLKQINRLIQKKNSNIMEEKQKTQQPLSERWQNTTKNMENIQKYHEFIKSASSFNNTTTTRLKTIKDYNQSQSFVNLQTPRSFNNVLPVSTKSLTQTDILSQSPVVNIHMENKRKLQRTNEPYFTRPFSRADQCTPGKSSNNFANLSKHRTVQSSNHKQRQSIEDQEEIQQLIQNSYKQTLNFKNIINSQLNSIEKLPLSQRN
ncbi:cyclic nucleotide-binding domain protein (macronuclear) [Tetrahymena thermophila SB210]|uniref:Cyclic nucleotide-binding domain protein n=1 Tax=Tetrahymena thermophila (strain SB210) TaxID=312017 RepID=I7MM49_TETTS|nr:cyclic nucleotide-binding domain protein [Tetrahymena thermophila SB210]EAS03962.2 cyclic nucleotide-binding domain protein [Tetrahymena thermophila SB210]|eukprot:XP_001024207.2 cyclic nucleotide-binding domain protein [Tetrahymena thermophila SB210]